MRQGRAAIPTHIRPVGYDFSCHVDPSRHHSSRCQGANAWPHSWLPRYPLDLLCDLEAAPLEPLLATWQQIQAGVAPDAVTMTHPTRRRPVVQLDCRTVAHRER